MIIDREAAAVETAARQYAASWRAGQGRTLLNRDTVATAMEAAFIAGACHARRMTVVEMDEVLATANAARHCACTTIAPRAQCPDPEAVPK